MTKTTRTLSEQDWALIEDALSYAAEDLAERANFENKISDPGGEENDYREAANRYSELLERLS